MRSGDEGDKQHLIQSLCWPQKKDETNHHSNDVLMQSQGVNRVCYRECNRVGYLTDTIVTKEDIL